MNFNPRFWHKRFSQQAGWTREVRRYIFRRLRIQEKDPVLEVGCGTGAVLQQLQKDGIRRIYGADIALPGLLFARGKSPYRRLLCADGVHLPLMSDHFEVCFCHYLLLWTADPVAILREMKRVTRPGGHLVLLAEPDYVQREDHPAQLQPLGELQNMALLAMGAQIDIGSRLRALMEEAGLGEIHVSMLKPATPHHRSEKDEALEWQVIAYDLQQLVELGHLQPERVEHYEELERNARQEGTRLLHIPTYFGWGRKS